MKKIWPLLVLGFVCYLVFALWTLPASVLTRFLPATVHLDGVHGSAWHGTASVVQVDSTILDEARWTLHPFALFLAQLKADVNLKRTDGFAQGLVAATAKQVTLTDFAGSIPLSALPPQVVPGGWTGMLNLRLTHAQIENGWPTSLDGSIEVLQLTGPARSPTNVGSYKVTFPAPNTSESASTLVGAIADAGGPMQIAGTLQLKADRSYVIDGMIAPRPDAPRDVQSALQFLGAPDAQGRRPFSLSGTL